MKGERIHTWRIDGITAVSRAIGDMDFKDCYDKPPEEQAITCVPDIKEEDLAPGDFIILACDGLWDVRSEISLLRRLTSWFARL